MKPNKLISHSKTKTKKQLTASEYGPLDSSIISTFSKPGNSSRTFSLACLSTGLLKKYTNMHSFNQVVLVNISINKNTLIIILKWQNDIQLKDYFILYKHKTERNYWQYLMFFAKFFHFQIFFIKNFFKFLLQKMSSKGRLYYYFMYPSAHHPELITIHFLTFVFQIAFYFPKTKRLLL